MSKAIRECIRPHIALARAAKVLHLKRPYTFPVLDELVVVMMGVNLARGAAYDLGFGTAALHQGGSKALRDADRGLRGGHLSDRRDDNRGLTPGETPAITKGAGGARAAISDLMCALAHTQSM